jgi:ribose 5-phosphate isomerase B
MSKEKYYIGSDHAGVDFKAFVKDLFSARGYEVVDMGPQNKDRVDYPDFAAKVCEQVLVDENSKGILICGSGIGMSMAANKFDGIRAALCHNEYSAAMARQHNDANILCLGERVSGQGMVEAIVDSWLSNSFEGGRHEGRVEKINALGKMGSCRV